MGKLSRTKGHSFERKIAQDLRSIFPQAKRHLEYQSQEAEAGQDLDGTKPFQIQTKKYAKYVNPSMIEQIKEVKGQYPVLITQGDRKRPIACMYYEDWKELLSLLKANGALPS